MNIYIYMYIFRMKNVAWSYSEHAETSPVIQSSLWDQAAFLLIGLYITNPVKLCLVRSGSWFIRKHREITKPQASQLCQLLCHRYIILSNIKYQVGITIFFANPRFLCFSFLSFLIFYMLARWRNGSQRQIRDDVSPLPRACAAGASYPQTERGSGKGERSCSQCTD